MLTMYPKYVGIAFLRSIFEVSLDHPELARSNFQVEVLLLVLQSSENAYIQRYQIVAGHVYAILS